MGQPLTTATSRDQFKGAATRKKWGSRPPTLQIVLLGDHVVGPFNQRHEYCRVAKLRSVVVQIRFGHAPGAGARATGVDLNMLGSELIQRFAYGRPSDRRDR